MYSFEPTEEQSMLQDAAKRLAENELQPAAHDADEARDMPRELIEKGWELGILQASVPEAYGGFGEHSAVTGVLATEELASGDLAAALAIMTPGLYAIPILFGGTEDQKKTLLPPIIEGEWKPYSAAFIEPVYDFYPLAMNTTAAKNGGSYILQGEKSMVPFADEAESMLVYADHEGSTHAFIADPKTEGIRIEEREALLGIQAIPTHKVVFENVHLPTESKIGGEDGFDILPILASSQIAVAAMGVGLSRIAYEYSRDYAKEREAFGGPIAQKQSIAFMLAEMATEIESIRLMVWEAAWKLDNGKDVSKAAYLAFSGACDMAMMVTDRAVQILGGHGYIREFPVERWMRNGRGIPSFLGLAMV
jgi:alkylation response protein AidB-like acyl-CoA dehydrogenase